MTLDCTPNQIANRKHFTSLYILALAKFSLRLRRQRRFFLKDPNTVPLLETVDACLVALQTSVAALDKYLAAPANPKEKMER